MTINIISSFGTLDGKNLALVSLFSYWTEHLVFAIVLLDYHIIVLYSIEYHVLDLRNPLRIFVYNLRNGIRIYLMFYENFLSRNQRLGKVDQP